MAANLALFTGVVLAGGHSTRMGTDKALLDAGGVPLWKRQYDLLSQIGASERFISMRTDQQWLPFGINRINDTVADKGPMVGLSQALLKSRYEHLAVVAVDLPKLTPAWFRRISTRCSDGIGVVGARADGTFEPLAAIYPRRLGAKMAGCVVENQLSLQKFIAEAIEDGALRSELITPEEEPLFENWNEPA